MATRNTQTVVASTVRAIETALMKGSLDDRTLSNINMFALINYYIDFTQETIDNGYTAYREINTELKTVLREFTYCAHEDICNYKIVGRTASLVDFLASNATITIDTVDIRISELQI
jgi:hypothetical protein